MQTSKDTVISVAMEAFHHMSLPVSRPKFNCRKISRTIVLYLLNEMRRYMIWFILAIFWGAIALAGLFRHRPGNAALEGAVAILFIVIGVAVKRRDAATAARYTANRPR